MSILRIDTSARTKNANSRAVISYLIEQLSEANAAAVVHRDLAQQPLPAISAEDLIDLHGSNAADRESLQQHWALSNELIAELKAADTLVIGAPMYNFGIPATLKQWLDFICRAGETFRYTENGPQGLTGIEHAYVVVASGGTAVGSAMDFVSDYMRAVLGFIGVKHVHIIDAAGSKRTPEKVIAHAQQQVDALLVGSAGQHSETNSIQTGA